jgi:hypothetical protein
MRVAQADVAPTAGARVVLKKLADARLVAIDRDDSPGEYRVELAHEALVSGWGRLSRWIDAARASLRTRLRLIESATEWQENGQDSSYLYGGARLAVAREWVGAHPNELNSLVAAFLAESERQAAAQARRLRQEKTRIDFEHNLAFPVSLHHFECRSVAIFGEINWELQPNMNVLLGRNGYGKSLLLRAMTAILQADQEKSAELFSVGNESGILRSWSTT